MAAVASVMCAHVSYAVQYNRRCLTHAIQSLITEWCVMTEVQNNMDGDLVHDTVSNVGAVASCSCPNAVQHRS
jgi:hypothetical protein